MSRRWSLVLGLVAALGCRGGAEQTPAPRDSATPEPAPCGRLVFVEADADGRAQVRSMPATGGAITPLTAAPIDPDGASYPVAQSPDASQLLLLSSREAADVGLSRDRLWLAALAEQPVEARPLELEPREQFLRSPSWAPDGSWLVFESAAHSFRDLYRVELGSGAVLRLTDDAEGNFEPTISPDGQIIAFVSSRDGNPEIYAMSSDGGDPRRLTNSVGEDTGPRWSPDGRTLAFCSSRARERGRDVFLMNANGSDQRPLLGERTEPVLVRQLEFSPDGAQLAFVEQAPRRSAAAIVVVSLATGEVTGRITAEGVVEQPSWSPDGRFLAFVRSSEGRSDIARVRPDGRDLVILTDGTRERWLPRWLADHECPRVAPSIAAEPGVG